MFWSQKHDDLIDLERATEIRRRALQKLPANRKRQRGFGAAKKKGMDQGAQIEEEP